MSEHFLFLIFSDDCRTKQPESKEANGGIIRNTVVKSDAELNNKKGVIISLQKIC